MTAAAITGLVLCGGRGQRIGGLDKPLEAYAGRALIDQVLERLAPQVSRILISANRNLEHYRTRAPVVQDSLGGFQGPLAGISAGFDRLQDPLLFVCPGDAPDLPQDLVARLSGALHATSASAAVAHDGTRRQSLHLLLRADTATSLGDYLRRGHRNVRDWLDELHAIEVDCADSRAGFRNLNHPEDFS